MVRPKDKRRPVILDRCKLGSRTYTIYRKGRTLYAKWSEGGRWRSKSLGTSDLEVAKYRVRGLFDGRPLDVVIETEDVPDFLSQAPQPTQEAPSIIQLAERHHTYARVLSGGRPGDAKQLMRGVREFAELFGEHPSMISSANVIKFYESLIAGGLSPKTAADRLKSVKWASATWSEQSGRADPLAGRRLIPNAPKRRPKQDLPLLRDVIEWALANPGPIGRAVALGSLGLRPSEIERAVWSDVEEGVIRIGERIAKNSYSQRCIPIPEPLLPLFCGGVGPVVPREDGSAHTKRNLSASFRSAGFDICQPNVLRKVCATELLAAGVRPLLVEAWLGHSASEVSGVTNAHYYVRPDGKELLPVAEAWAACAGRVAQPVTRPDAA